MEGVGWPHRYAKNRGRSTVTVNVRLQRMDVGRDPVEQSDRHRRLILNPDRVIPAVIGRRRSLLSPRLTVEKDSDLPKVSTAKS